MTVFLGEDAKMIRFYNWKGRLQVEFLKFFNDFKV